MTCIWSLVCDDDHRYVDIGQGYGTMEGLWTGEAKDMDLLAAFLNETKGKALRLVHEHELNELLDLWKRYAVGSAP